MAGFETSTYGRFSGVHRGVKEFAESLYKNPTWCPTQRISFEMYRALLNNQSDIPQDGDILDFNHLKPVPYVDALTLDRRMRTYLDQVIRRLSLIDARLNLSARVFRNLEEVLNRLA